MNDEASRNSAWVVVPEYRHGLKEVELVGAKVVCKKCGWKALRDERGEVVCSPYCPFCGEKMYKEASCVQEKENVPGAEDNPG